MEPSDNSPRVAIVEPQPLMREAIARTLEGSGIRVMGAFPDPSPLVNRSAQDEPTVAVLGLRFRAAPGGAVADGPGLVGELHGRCPSTALLVFSNSTDPEMVDRCYQQGAAGFLDKESADGPALVQAVSAVAQGERIFPLHLMSSPFATVPRTEEPAALQSISMREREVLTYVAAGADNLKIAAMLRISERTVKAHVSSLYKKLGSENRTQLALVALQLGIRPSAQV